MRLDDERESGNIEDQRGGGGFGGSGGGFGLGGGRGGGMGNIIGLLFAARGMGIPMWLIIIVGGGLLLFGGGLGGLGGLGVQSPPAQTAPAGPAQNQTDSFVRRVLGTTEDTWSEIFRANNADYPEPTLVFYAGSGRSGCGVAQSAMGPFYCPSDRKVYLDTSFFDELAQRFQAGGDFAAAYVIAHEVGHHVQAVTGQMDRARGLNLPQEGATGSQVRIELQADCYAGVWGGRNRELLEPGDVDEALRAATVIGDDNLQRQAGRRVSPDSFTHGSSEQRARWFKRGYDSGDPAACDTFAARSL